MLLSPHKRIRSPQIITPRTASLASVIGASKVKAHFQDNYETLSEIFNDMDTNHDRMVSYEEMFTFLNQRSMDKTGNAFDKGKAKRLFQFLDRDRDQQVSIEEIIQSYCDLKKQTELKIERLRVDMSEDNLQLEQVRKKITAQGIEELNDHGISPGSTLTVNVIEAQNLKPMDFGVSSDPYCILTVGDQLLKTHVIQSNVNPQWHEVFTFKPKTGQESIKVVIWDRDTVGTDDFEGQVEFPISDFKDQLKHDRYYNLEAEDPAKPWQGRIRLSFQWIHNKTEFYRSLESQWQDSIKSKQNQMDHQMEDLKSISEPFGISSLLFEEKKAAPPETQSSANIQGFDEIYQMTADFDDVSKNLGFAISEKLLEGEPVPWQKWANILVYVFLVVSSLSMFIRPDFGNVTMACASLYYLVDQNSTDMQWKITALGLGVFWIFDILWLMVHTIPWEKGHGSPEDNVRRFTIFISLINIIIKMPMLLVFWNLGIETTPGE